MNEKTYYEDFELDDYKDNSKKKDRKSSLKTKIIILFSLLIIFEIIFIICIDSVLRNKNNQLSLINFRKYLLDEGNKKLSKFVNDAFGNINSLDEELIIKENEIKLKEEEIISYKKKSKFLLKNSSPTPESIFTLQKENDNKRFKVRELVLTLYNKEKKFKDAFKTKIIDSQNDLNKIQSIVNTINVNDLKLCYVGENKDFNFTKAYNNCYLDKDIPALIIIQTNIYERYGIYLSTEKDKKSFVFAFKSGKFIEIEYVKVNNIQRQSLIYLINLIKNMKNKDNNKDKDKENNDIKDFDIIDLEIFHILI